MEKSIKIPLALFNKVIRELTYEKDEAEKEGRYEDIIDCKEIIRELKETKKTINK